MYRAEDKYTSSEKDLFLLQSKLKVLLQSDSNQKNDKGYKITSVYFDSYDDVCLREAIEGVRERKKYRIRIYNDSFETIKLEVKYKRDNRIDKRSCAISYAQMKKLMQGEGIEDTLRNSESPITLFNMAIKTAKLKPCIIVEYDRKAFTYLPGNVRITLDRNVRFSADMESFLAGNKGHYSPIPNDDCILEVKYDEFLPGFIARVLESGNMSQTSYSKYKLSREWQEKNYVF